MSEDHKAMAGAAILVIAGAIITFPLWRQTTSDWWKTQIVSRGYGTWETTTDGQVWFKWKEQSTKEEAK